MNSNESEPRIKELLLLERTIQKVNSILDLDILLEEIVGDVIETFGYTRSGVLLKDHETNELEIVSVRGWTEDYHVKGDRFKIGEYGMVGHVAATGITYYSPDVTLDSYYQVSEESTRSEIDIPLKINEELIGVFNVQHQEPDAFKPERIKLLESLACHLSTAIENARLFKKEKTEKERVINELNEARNIQLNLFPKELPVIPGFSVSGVCIPCTEAGGDWYDFIPFDDGRLGIVLADVSGKGMGAALLMSSTRSILRLVADSESSPGTVLQKVNNVLIKDFPSAKFVTMIYAVINPVDKTLVFANAGHLNPILINQSGPHFLETSAGLPLGIRNSLFSECKVEFFPGSRLIFYTDGVTEAMNSSLEEYGVERLKKHLANQNSSVQSILDDVKSFSKGNSQCDDITIVLIESKQ